MPGGRFSVEAIFKVVDRMTRPIRRIQTRMQRFSSSVGTGLRDVGRMASRFKFVFLAAAAAVVGAAAGIARALHNVVSVGMEFEQTMASAAAKFPGQIRQGTAEFEALEDAAKEVGATTEFTASQAAGGLRFLAMAGFDAQQAIAALPGLVDLATAAELDLDRASDIATDTLGAFGLAAEDAAERAANLRRVSDVLARTTTTANTNMEDMFEAIKMVAPVAASSGASIETVSAMIGELANSGIKATMSGTALRNVFNRLQAPAAEGARAMRRLGLQTRDAEGNMLDVYDILGDLGQRLEGMGTAERAEVLKDIFGDRAIAAVNILLHSGADRLREYRGQLEQAGGAAADMAGVMRDTTQGDLNSFNSAIEAMKLEIFDVVKGPLRELLQSLTEWFRANKDIISSGLTDMIQWLKDNTWAVHAALVALGVIMATLAVLAVAVAIGAFMMMLPFLLFVAVIFLIIRGFQLLWEWAEPIIDSIGEAMSALWEDVKNAFLFAWEFIVGLFTILKDIVMMHLRPIIGVAQAVVGWFVDTWRPVGEFFVGLWDGLVEAFKFAWGLVVEHVTIVIDTIKSAFEPLVDWFANLWDTIVQVFSDTFGFVLDSIGSVVDTIRGIGKQELSGEGGSADPVRPQVVSPQERVARSISERTTTTRGEVVIRDESGRAEMTRRPRGGGVTLQPSGAL